MPRETQERGVPKAATRGKGLVAHVTRRHSMTPCKSCIWLEDVRCAHAHGTMRPRGAQMPGACKTWMLQRLGSTVSTHVVEETLLTREMDVLGGEPQGEMPAE